MLFPLNGRRQVGAVAALIAATLPLTATQAAQAAPSAQARLASAAKKTPNRNVTAIVQFKAKVNERQARAIVRAHRGRVTDRLPAVKGFAVKLPARQASALRHDKKVRNVTLNSRVRTTAVDAGALGTNFPKTVGADKAWAAGLHRQGRRRRRHRLRHQRRHAGLPERRRHVARDQRDRQPGRDPPRRRRRPRHARRRHRRRQLAAPARTTTRGVYMGIAPEADLVALKTADDAGNSTVLDVINALQFVVDHKDELNIKVVNLSVSSDTPGSYTEDPLDAAVEFAWHAGIVVVAAQGNRGDAADAVQYAPGNDPFVISVGASDEGNTPAPADDMLAYVLQPRRDAGRPHQAGRRRPGRSHRRPAGDGQRVPEARARHQPRRWPVPEHRRHLDGRPGRRRRRGACAAGPPGPQPGPGQGAADAERQPHGRQERRDRRGPRAARRGRRAAPTRASTPNPQVEAALVEAGVDPTRATWTRATWTRATWTGLTRRPGPAPRGPARRGPATSCASGTRRRRRTRSTWSRSTWSRSTWSSVVEW